MTRLTSLSIIARNVDYTDDKKRKYITTAGSEHLTLTVGVVEVASCAMEVLWVGINTPFPTPPFQGGRLTKVTSSRVIANLGRCFKIEGNRESGCYVHAAVRKSEGCLVTLKNDEGKNMLDQIEKYMSDIIVDAVVVDERSEEDKEAFPIDYASMDYIK